MDSKQETLLDYLKKPSGYMPIVGIIITIIATYFITSYFQDKKEITIQESQYNFFTRNELDGSDINQNIRIYYNDREIYNPYMIKITITNSGNLEITEDDFKSNKFEISFNENIILYDTSISDATSKIIKEELASKIEIKDNCLLISPFLLNENEFFTISIITNQDTEIFYNFRIAGINSIKREKNTYKGKLAILMSLCSIAINIFTIANSKNISKKIRLFVISIIIILTIILLTIIFLSGSLEIEKNIHQFIFK